jgi:hypothetical protein
LGIGLLGFFQLGVDFSQLGLLPGQFVAQLADFGLGLLAGLFCLGLLGLPLGQPKGVGNLQRSNLGLQALSAVGQPSA